jgi:hypothetical protein
LFTGLKKALTILLLLSLFIEIAGYGIFFSFRQWQVKCSVKKSLFNGTTHRNTELLVFSIVEWEKLSLKEDEFFYQGEMYDVIEVHRKGKSVVVKCISDKKETRLINHYIEIAQHDAGPSGTKKASLVLKLISDPFIRPVRLILSPAIQKKISCHLFFQQLIPSFCSEVLTPPPQSC